MRITIVMGPFFPLPPGPGGAVERVWLGLAERFAQAGHEVTMISRTHESLKDRETVDGIHHIRLTSMSPSKRIYWDLLRDAWYSLRVRPVLPEADVTITNVFWLPRFMPKRSGKVVVNVNRFPKKQMWLYTKTDWLAVASSPVGDAVIEQTPATAPLVRVMPNPIEGAVFTPPEAPMPPNDVPTVLYTGRIHPEKGIHLLIDAFAIVANEPKDLRLKVMGPHTVERGGGGDEFLDQLKQRAGDAPVDFLEPIYDRHELAQHLRAADIYVYPSCADKGESFGIAPVEAMACSTPVIVSGLACFLDFIDEGETGLIFDHHAPDAAQQLAAHLRTLLDDPELRERLGRNGAVRARKFTYEAVADGAMATFNDLLAGRPMNPAGAAS